MKQIPGYVLGAAICIALALGSANAQTTAFNYQGSLNSSGTPATGSYDFEFALFDAVSGGAQQGATLTRSGVAVTNGIFSVSLDFGDQFPGADRFLEIRTRTAGGGAFTSLSPRQQVNSTPYAVRSLTCASADTVTVSGVPVGSANYIQNTTTPQAAANFNISGKGTVGGTLSGGTGFAAGTGTGVMGSSPSGTGVLGTTGSADSLSAGVSGISTGTGGVGVRGQAINGVSTGVYGLATAGVGVTGYATSGSGVFGQSTSGRGVFGQSSNDTGVFGQSTSGSGVVGATTSSNLSFPGVNGISAGLGGVGVRGEAVQGVSTGVFGLAGAGVGVTGQAGSGTGVFGSTASSSPSSPGVRGISTGSGGIGVRGEATTGVSTGVYGVASSGVGVTGQSTSGSGVFGTTNSPAPSEAGVRGISTGNGVGVRGDANGSVSWGVVGSSPAGTGVEGTSDSGTGVRGSTHSSSINFPGVYGIAWEDGGVGVQGQALNGVSTGVFGRASAGVGVTGQSISGSGVFGTSMTGLAGNFAGRVRVQTLGGAGGTSVCQNGSGELAFCSSSLRYKTNIGQFSPGMSFINKLRPISFDWKEGGTKDIGFGAEDVEKIDPRFVTFNDKGEVEGVKYDRLSVAFVNAFKEQQEQIETQQKQIRALTQLVCASYKDADICKEQ